MQIRVPTDAEYRAIRDAVRFIELNRQRILRVIGRRFMPIIGDGSGGGASSTAVRLFKIERRKRLSTNPPRWGYFGREVTYDADDHSLSNVTGGWASDGVILSQADEDTDLATITAPTPGTVLEPNGDDEIDFTWSSAVGATNYKIDFGSTQGGTDYATSTTASTSYSLDAADLPGDGSVVYVRMQSYISSTWVYNDYTFYDADTDLHLARNVAELNSTNTSDTNYPRHPVQRRAPDKAARNGNACADRRLSCGRSGPKRRRRDRLEHRGQPARGGVLDGIAGRPDGCRVRPHADPRH
jgi:hypothetical protein